MGHTKNKSRPIPQILPGVQGHDAVEFVNEALLKKKESQYV
jgi:hypothetical protein